MHDQKSMVTVTYDLYNYGVSVRNSHRCSAIDSFMIIAIGYRVGSENKPNLDLDTNSLKSLKLDCQR